MKDRVTPTVEDLEPNGRPPKRVVVVGAGIAGLAAATQLVAAGHDVTVLEARLRAGGRVCTLREPFADGLHAEAGAFFVPADHAYLMKYVTELGFALDPVPPRDVGSFCFIRGQRVVADATGTWGRWPLRLRDDEHALDLEGLLHRYLGVADQEMGDVSDPDWPPPNLREYDELTVLELFERNGASPEARHLLRTLFLTSYGDVGHSVSALFFLQQYLEKVGVVEAGAAQATGYRSGAAEGHWQTIRGGNDQLPLALARRLGERIRYGAAVLQIEHAPERVAVAYRQAGCFERLEADHVICALPFSCLREIEVTPTLSPPKRRAIEQLRSTSVAHLFLQTRTRPWLAAGAGRPVLGATDLPIDTVRDATHNQPGTRGIVNAFTIGQHARALAAMDPEQRIAYATLHLDRVLPGVAAEVEGALWFDWDAEPWSRGDYVWYRAGEFLRIFPHVAQPEGRVHFAGDQTSQRSAWQDGAISSGHRAAREVHAFDEERPPA